MTIAWQSPIEEEEKEVERKVEEEEEGEEEAAEVEGEEGEEGGEGEEEDGNRLPTVEDVAAATKSGHHKHRTTHRKTHRKNNKHKERRTDGKEEDIQHRKRTSHRPWSKQSSPRSISRRPNCSAT